MEKDKNLMAPKDFYTSIGENYRFFLNWRHALLAGYFASLFALFNAYTWMIENDTAKQVVILYVCGILISIFFWGFEYRIRDLYRACIAAGKEIEEQAEQPGLYAKLSEKKRPSHSTLIDALFSIVIIFNLGMIVCFAYQ